MRGVCLFVLALAIPSSARAAARVSSNSECPSADTVRARLLGLLPAGGPEKASARVYSDGQTMRIDLSTSGEETQQRRLPVGSDGDCNARAELAAYVIAAWLDAMPVGTVKAPGIPPRERRPLESSGGGYFDDPDAEHLSINPRTMLGAGVLGTSDSLGPTVGALVLIGMPSLVEQTGWSFESSLTSSRQLSVGQGTATLRRPTFTLGLTTDFYRSRWAIRGQLGASLGVLMVRSSGYIGNTSGSSVMWGLDVGLTVVRRWQRNEGWVLFAATAWPQGRSIVTRLTEPGTRLSKELPSWEFRLVLGYSLAVL